jgi:hypothetical protein
MENIKQHLLGDTISEFKAKEAEIKKSDEEIKILEAKIKVEKRFFELKDITEEMREDVKYSLQALEGMAMMEKERNANLRKELEMLRVRKQVINKFEEEDFKY